MSDESKKIRQQQIAFQILDQCSNKDTIYRFMQSQKIGESDFGRLIDEIGRTKRLYYHRLEGHHPFLDFPFNDPDHIPDFIEHVWISDFATKQGLPIIPNRFLENSIVKDYIQKKTMEWNFLNVFDVMVGTLAIYAGYKNCQRYFSELDSIESFEQLASALGIGVIELAIAVSKQNPLLFIGAIFQLIGTAKGLLNSSEVIYFRRITSKYYMVVVDPEVQIDQIVKSYYLSSRNPEKELSDIVKSYYPK